MGITAALTVLLSGCTRHDDTTMRLPAERPVPAPAPEGAPVALNIESPVQYPPALLAKGIDATVVLRLFVTEQGAVVRESTHVAESSGYPAFDSAAVAAAPKLRFAPALQSGTPVAVAFLQPVQFRHSQGGR